MAKLITLDPPRTYATAANAVKAVTARYPAAAPDGLRYVIMRTDAGRYYPVFIGEWATLNGVHRYFCVVN